LKKEKEGDRLKLSLSIKQAELDPWSQIDSLFKVGSVAAGRVTRCMAFGAFVEIHPGIEGLIPLSEMSYTKRVVKSDDLVKPGDKIAVMIKDIDAMAKRVSLSLKDAGTDPWALIPQKFPVGSQTKGKVQKRETFGLFIELEPGVVGLLHKSKANDAPDFPYEKLKPGDEVTVQIAEIQYEARKLSLAPPGDEIVAIGDYNNTSAQMGTLADKFKDLFKK
jgi:small subunit ribosomal protein S1